MCIDGAPRSRVAGAPGSTDCGIGGPGSMIPHPCFLPSRRIGGNHSMSTDGASSGGIQAGGNRRVGLITRSRRPRNKRATLRSTGVEARRSGVSVWFMPATKSRSHAIFHSGASPEYPDRDGNEAQGRFQIRIRVPNRWPSSPPPSGPSAKVRRARRENHGQSSCDSDPAISAVRSARPSGRTASSNVLSAAATVASEMVRLCNFGALGRY